MISKDYLKVPGVLGRLPEGGKEFPSLLLQATIEHLTREVERLELARAAFQESEFQLDGLLDSVGECMTMLDHELYIVWSNKAARDLFGEKIIGRKCHQIYHQRETPCDPRQCPVMLTFADDTGTKEYDTQVLDQNGQPIDLHCTFNVAIRDESGKPSTVISVARNITERIQAEKIIRKSKEEWERTFDAIGEPVAIHDRNLCIVRCNKAFRELMDLPWSELTGKPCQEISCGQPKNCDLCPLGRTLQDNIGHSVEITGPDHKKTYWVSTHPILTDTGESEGVIRTIKDISEIKSLEAQVRQAQKMEAIGTLAGGIAHDFKSVLTVIHGFTELAMNMIPSESMECRGHLNQVLTASNRANGIVKQILTFSRRNDEIMLQPMQLHAALAEILSMIRASLPKNIQIREIIACDSAEVLADPTQIHQVLMNLCTNASQAMSEKGGVLELGLDKVLVDKDVSSEQPELSSGLHYLITVKDNGHGMDEETMERIFEPFFTTKPEGVGTGMGLSMVHGIVQSHKGAIKVYSEKGKGTTFKIFLPAYHDDRAHPTKKVWPRLDSNLSTMQ